MIRKSVFGWPVILIALTIAVVSGCKKSDDDNDDDNNNNPPAVTENDIKGIAKDAITYEDLTSGTITLTTAEGAVVATKSVGADGGYEFPDVSNGTYSLKIEVAGYKDMTAKNIQFGLKAQTLPVFAAMLPVQTDVSEPVAAVSGIVVDSDYNPVPNATISLSADSAELTNGYFTSANSNDFGFFFIGAVPLASSVTGGLIPSFKARCVKDGYETVVHTELGLVENELMIVNFVLSNETSPGNAVFTETAENDNNAWEMTGFWHRQMNEEIYNNAYPQYVQLAPNDETEGRIPPAYQGQYDFWYGEVETGNFMGEPEMQQDTLSGGTSMDDNEGTLTSPVIDLTGLTEASLSFWSWYEIESVNPNEFGYDIMEIFVVDMNNKEDSVSIGRLNPYSDPVLDDRESLPFTSGGFNKAPIWSLQEFDLTEFAGTQIKLKFNFRTIDGLYNGFRGWFVDNISVWDKGIITKSSTIKEYPADPKPRR